MSVLQEWLCPLFCFLIDIDKEEDYMNPAELKAVVEYMESDRGVEREVIIRALSLLWKVPLRDQDLKMMI